MIETKIRKVGNSAVMTLTTEMLTILDAKEGDTLFVVRGDDGSLKITPHDPRSRPHWPLRKSSWMKIAIFFRPSHDEARLGSARRRPRHS